MLDALQLPFFQRGLAEVLLLALGAGLLGTWIVLRGLAFIGDAVSHAAFPGLVIAFMLGVPLYLGGAVAAIATALAIGWVSRRGGLRFDTAVGVLFAGMFALGIVDKLTPGSLTGGKFIAGTGTIDDSGHVGAIGGIAQKMVGAKRKGATVFLSPSGNCAQARDTVPDGLRLVRVKTLSDAVEALEDLRAGRVDEVPTC